MKMHGMAQRLKVLGRTWFVFGTLLSLASAVAYGQTPGRSFRSPALSRVVPVENVAPVEEEQGPTPASSLRPSAPRPIPAEKRVPVERSAEDRAAAPREPLAFEQSKDVTPLQPRTLPKRNEPLPERVATAAKIATLAPKKAASAKGEKSGDSKQDDSKDPADAETSEELKEGVDLVKDEVQLAWQKVLYVWQYPFFKTKDFDLSLQVIVGGLVLLWIGNKLARRLSNWLGGTVLKRVGLPPATAAPLQKMSFYILFGLFAVFSLQLVGVPMTVFTFFGGALAIGIGFGSQNVMNNFISGLILLIERPIRVGDVIQIESHSGKVSEIGARSTRITTGSNLEVIIPNSTFLQGNVVNWTLSDDVVSSKVTVGVAYGSPAREVARLLKQAAEGHEKILKTPAPGVAFTEFAADSMQFELSFWLKMSQADRGRVESDLRFKIDEIFADRGIVIAYPQRDVHLNLMRPVEVRLSEPTAAPREFRGAA
jgi:small-conductance mechanosensitive channel